jgi:quercetin dioxygenase-like cupin family protein
MNAHIRASRYRNPINRLRNAIDAIGIAGVTTTKTLAVAVISTLRPRAELFRQRGRTSMKKLLVLSHRKSLGAAVAASLLSVFVLAAPAYAQQAEATAVLPESLKWNPTPFPDVTVAVVAGNPTASGIYAIFAKYRAGGRSAPHTHPDQRVVTVLSGTYYSGLGAGFDEAKLRPLHSGSVLIVPANTPHYALAKDGETVVQEVGMGPTATNIWPKAAVNQ